MGISLFRNEWTSNKLVRLFNLPTVGVGVYARRVDVKAGVFSYGYVGELGVTNVLMCC